MLERLNKLTDKQKTFIALGIFALLIAVFYGSTLQNGFIYDDSQQVVDNVYLRSFSYLPKVVTGCIWESAFGQCEGRSLYYRPAQSFSYLLTYQISSSAGLFHAVNLVYFFVVVSLIFILGKLLSKNSLFGFVAALLFLMHPINSQVVNWVAAVPELTFAIFILLAAIFYLRFIKATPAAVAKGEKKKWTRFFKGHNKNLIFVYLFYFFALLSKEAAALLPILFLFIDWAYLKKKIEDFFKLEYIAQYAAFAVPLGIYFLMRMAVLGGGLLKQGAPVHGTFSFGDRVFTFFSLFAQYLSKLFYPYPLLFFYSFEKKSTFSSLEFFASFIAVVLFFVLVGLFWWRARHILLFSLLWLFIFLAPVLVFLTSLGEDLFSERYLFVSNIGFAFAVAYFFVRIWKKDKRFRIGLVAVSVLLSITALGIAIERNAQWHDNETIYTKTLEQNPAAYPIRFNWATYLRNTVGDFDRARIEFEKLLAQNSEWGDTNMVYMHLGDYERDVTRNMEKAFELYQASLTAAGSDWKSHFTYDRIGGLYAGEGEYTKALPNFCRAVQINPDAEAMQARLNRAISLAVFETEQQRLKRYEDIIAGDAFQLGDIERVRNTNRVCEDDQCTFFFASRFEETEVVFPFLISVKSERGDAPEIIDSGFNPETAQIALVLDSTYENTDLTFLFPTCEGTYYEAVATLEE